MRAACFPPSPQVRYHVRCSPRAWVGPVLVWEPVGLAAPREADEWMYELQRLDAGSDAAAAAAAMAAVFAMVPAGPPGPGGRALAR